jgi:CubicO group peptidase (beta-lactamase class C family)
MSCTKGMTATVAHVLVERGLLDVNAPVSQYWPEFSAQGKHEIPVSYLLSHKAGLAAFPPESGIGPMELLDWARSTQALADMEPLWSPGTAFAYHSLTFGHLVGEVIRRASGRTVGRYFAEEIAQPLHLDLWLGLPENEEEHVSRIFTTLQEASSEQQLAMLRSAGIDTEERIVKVMVGGGFDGESINRFLNSRPGHAGEIPSGNGIGNARSLAKMYAATIGEVDGVRLLQSASVDRARIPQTDTLTSPAPFDKLPMQHPLRFALGYELERSGVPMLGDTSFGHSGAGGRLGFAHPASGTAVGYVCNNAAWNYMAGPDARWIPWTEALKEALHLA